jgi:hypothetical protein
MVGHYSLSVTAYQQLLNFYQMKNNNLQASAPRSIVEDFNGWPLLFIFIVHFISSAKQRRNKSLYGVSTYNLQQYYFLVLECNKTHLILSSMFRHLHQSKGCTAKPLQASDFPKKISENCWG